MQSPYSPYVVHGLDHCSELPFLQKEERGVEQVIFIAKLVELAPHYSLQYQNNRNRMRPKYNAVV